MITAQTRPGRKTSFLARIAGYALPGLAALCCQLFTALPAAAQGIGQVNPAGLQAILAPPLRPEPLGSPAADVTIVEYFDYNCPVCRKMEPDVRKLLAGDAHVRLVHKDWPIFGAVSAYAAYCTFAAADLGHYAVAHQALMEAQGKLGSREAVEAVLNQAGLDVAAIRADIQVHQAQFSAVLTRNAAEANGLGLQGTPGILVGNQLVDGGLDVAQLRMLVDRARKAARRH